LAGGKSVTLDELPVLTLEDLERRIALGSSEYDVLMAAALLRKLLLEEQPLLTAANRRRRLPIRYRVTDLQVPRGTESWSNEFIHPDDYPGAPTVELNQDAFLARTVHKEAGELISVREFVKFMD
jgi:hypothetical protein